MVCDWDDVWPGHDGMTRLYQLRELRPDFKCTLFAVPGRAFPPYWNSFPDWIELAVHGWTHSPLECADWTVDDFAFVIHHKPERFVDGFKAPFWAISDGCYEGLQAAGWWVADHPMNDSRRPEGIRSNVLDVGPEHWHGHIGNDCGNGIEETWDHVCALVEAAASFEFMSECVQPWRAKVTA